jgi:enoyl-CoA hydratase
VVATAPSAREQEGSQMEDVVLSERRGAVALLTLNRPQARNAINVELAKAIFATIDAAQDAGCIVLTGADPAFCAGLDLRNLGVDKLADIPWFNEAVRNSGVPVIAAVNGAAVAGGLELALAADFIVASENARFADTHLRVGVYPGPVAVDLPRRVGMAKAREMSLTGNFVDAQTAGRIGLANHVVPHAELIPFTMTLAEAIAEQDRKKVATLRRDWRANATLPMDHALAAHLGFSVQGGHSGSSSANLTQSRDGVLERSRQQRGG